MFYYIALILGLIYIILLAVKTPHLTPRKITSVTSTHKSTSNPNLKSNVSSSTNLNNITNLKYDTRSITDTNLNFTKNEISNIKNLYIPPHGVNFITLQNNTNLGINYHPNACTINANHKYAIIVANRLEPKSTLQYFFQIPLACSAWTEMGYGCLVVIPYVGDLPRLQQ